MVKFPRAVIASFSVKFASIPLALILSVALARILGVVEYGRYAYVMSIVGILSIFAKLGIPALIRREVAVYLATQKWSFLRGLLRWANGCVIVSSIVIVSVACCAIKLSPVIITQGTYETLLWGLLLLPIMALSEVREGAIIGLHRAGLGQSPELIIRPLSFLAIVAFFYVVFPGSITQSVVAMKVQVMASTLAFFFGVLLLRFYLPVDVRCASSKYSFHKWSRSSASFLLIGSIFVVNTQVDILMLGVFGSIEDVGVYRVIVNGASFIIFARTAMDAVFGPHYARQYAIKQFEGIQHLMNVSVFVTSVFALCVAGGFIFFGDKILAGIFGAQFSRGAPALAIICFCQFLCVLVGSVQSILNMTNHESDTLKAIIIALIVNVFLNACFIPVWGIEGAAAATGISTIMYNFFLAFSVYRRLGVYAWCFRRS